MTTEEKTSTRLPIRADTDLMVVRQRVRVWAQRAGFGLVQQTKLVTAASELARNTLVHGGGGNADLHVVSGGPRGHGLSLTFSDEGPGIPDVEMALRDGYSTAGGLGMGLSGAKRLVHEFSIDTAPGLGTSVTITAWAGTAAPGLR